MLKGARVLVVISDRGSRKALVQVLESHGLEPIHCSTVNEARAILATERIDVVFCEAIFADGSVDDLLLAVGLMTLTALVIVCSPLYDPAAYLDVMNRGVFDFIVCPFRTDDVQRILGAVSRRHSEPMLKPRANTECATSA